MLTLTQNHVFKISIATVLVLGVLLISFAQVGAEINANSDVVAVLAELGIYDPPAWLVSALAGAATVSAIVGILATMGWSFPAWAIAALLAADTYGA
ncbi:hypothetical protein [Thermoactinomyces mirandus]|uniref:Uncharacterized protein n=1 Tax=Thermoactinomyces mirandus TaxID=2756294 RepID=A0A7W1XU83_9BACL|nr:hypothetical protein [Thermoactinomyces mirandus]MBA4603301.1 hypothetical protein [Thermoactinomyces mirandus]